MARISDREMLQRRVCFLEYVDACERSEADGPALRKGIMDALGLSVDQFRTIRCRLVDEELVYAEPRFLETGGQVASVYHLTEKGQRALGELRELATAEVALA